ncbi:imidazole glycerol phosphate synthase cyclase subunit [Flavobacteriaceae bacterium]|jgi:imidazole glycerol-phosphate synthase subunit HisF|nr:imidazole glycerol phosphate synthase cyclase subunit [Flavobacteriaceae bacterium]
MKLNRIIARLDVNNDYVVKGKFLEGLRKVGKPNELALKYYEQGIDEIVFLDAVASLYDRNSLISILSKACKEVFIPITIGGGIKSISDIENLLKAGADKVAINSAIFDNPKLITESVKRFGSQAIVGSLVCRKHRYSWEAFRDNAKHRTNKNAIEWAKILEDLGVGEIMVSSIHKDGLLKGFDLELIKSISDTIKIPLIVSGGAGNSNHVASVINNSNCDAVAVGSLLHYELESVEQLKLNLKKQNIKVRL